MRLYCKEKGIVYQAYSVLGSAWAFDGVLKENPVLKVWEQLTVVVAKSITTNKKRVSFSLFC